MQNKPLEQRHGHSLLIVRLIAVGKLLKSACLFIIGSVIMHSIRLDKSVNEVLHDFINALRIDERNELIHSLLEKSLGVNVHILPWLSAGTIIYSALYAIEGTGLMFDRGWAEWMTVITTAGFIPLEIFEIFRHLTLFRIIIFILNVLVLVYISMRLWWRHLARLEARAAGATIIIPGETRITGIKP